jgi:hypothetical protein
MEGSKKNMKGSLCRKAGLIYGGRSGLVAWLPPGFPIDSSILYLLGDLSPTPISGLQGPAIFLQ